MAEITPEGFVGKTENEYFDEEKQLYQNIDPDWNLDPSTPDGLKIASDAEIFANLDETARLAYNSKDPNRARDADLDTISALTGTFRSLGTPSNVTLTLTGVAGTVIIAGKLVESIIDGSQWSIDNTVTIGGGGSVAATATCTVNGATQADADSITRIVDVVGGWQSVTNPTVATPGTDVQTDSSLRQERRNAVARPGNNQVDNITGEVLAVDGVRHSRTYENEEATPDSEGRPGHSISTIVDGGDDIEVAEAIYRKKNPGVLQYQPPAATPVNVIVTSPLYSWNTKEIKYSRPDYIDMVITVTVVNDGSLPGNADQLIKDAILEYSQGVLVDASCGFRQVPYTIGENVVFSGLYTPINHVIGQYGNSYVNGLTLNGGSVNVSIDWFELSRWTEANITVNVT